MVGITSRVDPVGREQNKVTRSSPAVRDGGTVTRDNVSLAVQHIEGTNTARFGLDASVGHSSDGLGLLVLGVEVGEAKGGQEAQDEDVHEENHLGD